jgi:hypothetical protein
LALVWIGKPVAAPDEPDTLLMTQTGSMMLPTGKRMLPFLLVKRDVSRPIILPALGRIKSPKSPGRELYLSIFGWIQLAISNFRR